MSASERSLPAHPSLQQQRKLAKELLGSYRAGDPEAVDRVRACLPDKDRIVLADAQFTLAREYGFHDWAALKARIEELARRAPGEMSQSFHEELRAAFEARDLTTLRSLIRQRPDAGTLVDAPLFPFDSPALVHFAAAGDLPMVEMLLDLGADPDRRSDWWAGGFHALHTARAEVADRLLEAGATPDACAAANLDRPDLLESMLQQDPERVNERGGDGQTPLHFARSRQVVDLLLSYGADPDARDVDHRATPAQWMLERTRGAGRYDLAQYLVQRGASVDVFLAAALGLGDRLREMLQQDPSLPERRTGQGSYGEQPPSSFHIYTWTIGQNLSPLQVAAQFEQQAAVDALLTVASPAERVIALCSSGRVDEARRLLDDDPDRLDTLRAGHARALPDAAWAGNVAAVAAMLELGFDPAARGQDGGTALHCAAWRGDAECVAALLRHPEAHDALEMRDTNHGSTPLGWCCHGSRHCAEADGDYPRVARLLLEAGARPGPNLKDATDEVLAVIDELAGT